MAAVMQNIKIAPGMKFMVGYLEDGRRSERVIEGPYQEADSAAWKYEHNPLAGLWDYDARLREPEWAEVVKPAYDDAAGWAPFVPAGELPDTGSKAFKAGEVYACGNGTHRAVYLVEETDSGGVSRARRLAGCLNRDWFPRSDSNNARHSALIFTAGDEVPDAPGPRLPVAEVGVPQTPGERWSASRRTSAVVADVTKKIAVFEERVAGLRRSRSVETSTAGDLMDVAFDVARYESTINALKSALSVFKTVAGLDDVAPDAVMLEAAAAAKRYGYFELHHHSSEPVSEIVSYLDESLPPTRWDVGRFVDVAEVLESLAYDGLSVEEVG